MPIMKMPKNSSSHASLAQLVERSSHKAKVDSSIMSGGKAKKLFGFVLFCFGSGRFAQICFVLGQLQLKSINSTYPTHPTYQTNRNQHSIQRQRRNEIASSSLDRNIFPIPMLSITRLSSWVEFIHSFSH